MPRSSDGVELGGKRYNLITDHETYVVTDVPARPDTDQRMERRVNHSNFKKGILKRRDSEQDSDTSIYSINLYNRIEKIGTGLYAAWGGDTRMGDRIFGQRATSGSNALASAPLFMGDGDTYSYIACKQHLYQITGITGGVQQLALSKDFSAITPAVNITDVVAFNGRIYVATAQTTNGVPDPAKPQVMWVWDQATSTTNWSNPPTPLGTPTWASSVQTTLSGPAAASVATILNVTSTTGFPAGNFTALVDSELMTLNIANGTTFNIVTRGLNGSGAPTHNAGAAVIYNPAVSVTGTAGTTRYQYYVIAVGASADSQPSTVQSINFGNATLSATNYNTITWQAVTGATSYKIYRSYSGGTPSTTGIIATGVAGTTYNDQGAAPTSNQYQITPQFAIGDTGKAIAFAVIRNNLWRAAGSKMWSWDGQLATWTGESIIGNPTTNITALDVYQDGLIIFKQDGIYTLDRGGNVFPLFPGFRTLGMNPRPLGQWQGAYFFASDVGMVWKWDGSKVESIGFDFAEAYPFPDGTYGLHNAATRGMALPNYFLVGFNKWIGTGQDTVNNGAYYFAWDGSGWHPMHYDPSYQVSGLGLTGGNQAPPTPALQFGKIKANGSSFALSYMTQPTLDPLLATSFDTIPQTYVMPVDHGIIPDEWKVFEGVRCYVENSSAGTLRLQYALDDDIQNLKFTDLGVPRGDKTSSQLFTPSNLPAYRRIMIKAIVTPSASTGVPIIRTIMYRYKQRESQRKSWKMIFFLEEGQMNPNRAREHRTAQQMLRDLNVLRKNRTLVEFKDIVGDTYSVYVEQVEESLKKFGNSNNVTSFTCTVVVVEPVEIDLSA